MKNICLFCFTFVALLLLNTSARAGVILTLTDDGTDLTFHYTGTMDLVAGHDFVGNTDRDRPGRIGAEWYSFSGDFFRGSNFGAGINSGTHTVVTGLAGGTGDNVPSNGVGLGFGINGSELWWDQAYGNAAGTINVDRMWTHAGITVDSFLGTSTFLDSGPAVLWTHNDTGSAITMVNGNLAAVPEPSSLGLIWLGMIRCSLRRRRRTPVV